MANAAELTREYKELLDAGIITQAEFDKKKEKFLAQESLEPHLWIECVIKGHELLSDGVITEADFETIKANAFSDKGHGYKTDIGDITQLKALLDDGCIGEKDFEDLKSRVLKGDKIYTLGYVDTLGFLRDSHSKGIFGDASYEALKKKFLNARTDPYHNLRSNTENLASMHKLLDEGYISAEDYAVFEKNAAGGSVVRSGATVSPIRTFKALSDKGLITEDELSMIRKNLLFAKKINGNFAWPGFFEKVAELSGKGILSDDELASLKSAYIHGSKIPDEEAFARIERYDGLANEGLFEEDEFDILKDRAFSGVEVLTDEKLEGVREYKKLLDEGTISNDDDAHVIQNGIAAYSEAYEQEYEKVGFYKKLVDKDGQFAAGVIAEVDKGADSFVNALFVEEPLRLQGLGTYLLKEAEEFAKENGAHMILTNAGDWNVDFFRKNGYLLRGELKDVPEGHSCYELYKKI